LSCASFGCDVAQDVVLGDLPMSDAALGQEDSSPDAMSTDAVSIDAMSPDAGRDDATPCAPGGNVTSTMRQFLTEAVGFGASATGGSSGCVYHVTSLADAGEGSLRDGAERGEALWIVFDISGVIELSSPIAVGSNKTLDGRIAAITIKNFGLILGAATSDVVIEHLTFLGNMSGSNNDAIQIADGARTVWIDHCSFSSYGDGLIDITHAATDVTVSWSAFSAHDFVMLVGRSPEDVEDVNVRVTLHHNWWNQTGSYAPRLRFGKAHLLNNLIDRWRTAAAACTMGGEIYSEGNVFIARDDKQALATSAGTDTVRGRAKSIGDWLQNGAVVDQHEGDLVFQPSTFYSYTPERAEAALESAIRAGAGAR
jgi:pectate lyase